MEVDSEAMQQAPMAASSASALPADADKSSAGAMSDSSSGSSGSTNKPLVPQSMFEHCIEQAMMYKDAGTGYLQAGDPQRAIGKWLKISGCLSGLDPPAALLQNELVGFLSHGRQALTPEQRAKLHALQHATALNLGLAYIKVGEWGRAVASAEQALSLDARSAKARFRRAVALQQLGRLDEAVHDLQLASELAPNDAAVRDQLAAAKRAQKDREAAQEEKMRQQFKNMFTTQ